MAGGDSDFWSFWGRGVRRVEWKGLDSPLKRRKCMMG